jgi:DNA-binding NarL/FixJ family response regulator
VVVDDHMIFREGLRALLGRVDDIEIVGEAATTQEAIEVTKAARPDVVLMDLHLPADGGEAGTTTILASHPEIAVLVLTMHSDDTRPRHALHAGARGHQHQDGAEQRLDDPSQARRRRPRPSRRTSPVTLEWIAVPNPPGLRDAR